MKFGNFFKDIFLKNGKISQIFSKFMNKQKLKGWAEIKKLEHQSPVVS